jgi:predicted AAA+ superfamily ATPase
LLFQNPYRGALFENLIVTELMKNRFNKGQRSNLYFWRDNTGHEVDIIIDNGLKQIPLEVKSGRTIKQEFFKGLGFWEKLTQNPEGIIVYGGDEGQIRSGGIQIKSWRNIGDL